VKYLLDLEAATSVPNNNGKLALDLAKESLVKATEGIKVVKAAKGSLIDRLQVTVATLEKQTKKKE
jgi:hypothetical protein